MMSKEGKHALEKWKKIRDYIVPSVTLSFSEEAIKQAFEIAFAEKIPNRLGLASCSIAVPAALVCLFSHLSPKVIRDEKI